MVTKNTITDDEALDAVQRRDPTYDGRFVYAVITTGIFCKPSCSSRQAKSENTRFFQTIDQASDAGFRACKKCKPDQSDSMESQMVQVARYIETHVQDKITLATLAKKFDLSPSVLQKTFKSVFALSPREFQEGLRQQKFKSLLKGHTSVTEAIYEAGYGSTSRVYEESDSKFGMTPSAYLGGAEKENIVYTSGKTTLGLLMLAATDKGVCFAMFGKSKAELKTLLEAEFPKAELTAKPSGADARLSDWFSAISEYLKSDASLPDIPLDLRGTVFQIRVWEFLRTIARGEVVTYKGLAQAIGQPAAVRAAGTACGKNRIAVLIPCHRVLRSDGAQGGYRWGVERKQQLLAQENNSRPIDAAG